MSVLKKITFAGIFVVGFASVHAAVVASPSDVAQQPVYLPLVDDSSADNDIKPQILGSQQANFAPVIEVAPARHTAEQSHALWLSMQRGELETVSWSGGKAQAPVNFSEEVEKTSHIYLPIQGHAVGHWSDLTSGDSYADFKFSMADVTAVPEPETYGMMLAGLSLIGLLSRRRAAK